MRKAIIEPNFEHYLKVNEMDDQALVFVLKGHLVIEALLVELIELKENKSSAWNLNFPQKVDKCCLFGFISEEQSIALKDLNNLRNDFAHILGNKINFDRIFTLILATSKGFEFTDETIYSNRTLSEEWYGIEGGIVEVLNSFFCSLAETIINLGGIDHFG